MVMQNLFVALDSLDSFIEVLALIGGIEHLEHLAEIQVKSSFFFFFRVGEDSCGRWGRRKDSWSGKSGRRECIGGRDDHEESQELSNRGLHIYKVSLISFFLEDWFQSK
jgi:hypothetical protein